ncbi:MAG TPA: PAS-domain containing protein, partial [Azospirillaceae bacterium]|nr:PAS-domain containing protein [Azospirillaceae bacterium]
MTLDAGEVEAAAGVGPGFARFDAEGRLTWANAMLVRHLGLPAASAGTALAEMLVGVNGVEGLLRRLRAGELVEAPGSGGRTLGLSLGADADGGSILTVFDLVSAKAREACLETTLENLNQGVTVFDGDLRLVAWNRLAWEVLDLPRVLAQVGTPMETFIRFSAERGEFGPGDPDELTVLRMELARRREAHVYERVRQDGRVLEVRGMPIAGGGFVTTYSDVTDRKRFATELEGLAGSLEVRVRERTAELEDKRVQLESTLDAMSDAISVFDKDMRLVVWNQRYEDLFSLPHDLLYIGCPFTDIVRQNIGRGDYGEVADPECLLAERVELARKAEPYGYRFHRVDGVVLETRHRPMPDG